jgi:hypothetical protein
MADEKKLTEFTGISAPETPKYIILINFLERYFKVNNNKFSYDAIVSWDNNKIMSEEGDPLLKQNIKRSFQEYINAYSGLEATYTTHKNNKRYFPIIPDMITSTRQFPLRHLLYSMQMNSSVNKKNFRQSYEDMQKKLYEYLYPDVEQSSSIYRILEHIFGDHSSLEHIRRNDPPEIVFGIQRDQKYFKELSELFCQQLEKILTNKNLIELDIYRRIEFLSTFLGLFVLQYILERTNSLSKNKKDANIIICKGSTDLDTANDAIHRASQNCYVNIRALFPEMMKSYYKKQIDEINVDTISFSLLLNSNDINVKFDDNTNMDLLLFLKKYNLSISTRMQNKLLQKFRDTFITDGNTSRSYNKDDFALEFYNMQKSIQGSSVAKISSTLPTTGRDINILFPKSNARQKYFAMSGEIAEFFVRLYLIQMDTEFGYFDDFIEWLQAKYSIFIRLDLEGVLTKYLHRINSSVTVQDSNKNENAFIKTLLDANCLIKLSDSGFIVVLPEKKGEVSLI